MTEMEQKELADLVRTMGQKIDGFFANYEQFRRTMDWYASTGAIEIHHRARKMLRLLQPYNAKSINKVRLGSPNDGGYIMLDDFANVDVAFSFGIEQNAAWDIAVADRGLTVYQFDHTIESAPIQDERLIWAKRKITATSGDETESITSLVERHDKGRDHPNLILKIDIEHDEWPVFEATPIAVLGRFAQITCEMHGFDFMGEQWWQERTFRVLDKLNVNYGVVHVHANNYCGIANVSGVAIPHVLEVTFANKRVFDLEATDELFPGPLDAPCDPRRPDIFLGSFRF